LGLLGRHFQAEMMPQRWAGIVEPVQAAPLQETPSFLGAITLAVSRADSRSEARAKAVGVGSSAWFGQARTPWHA
jgi:hypothetical protein